MPSTINAALGDAVEQWCDLEFIVDEHGRMTFGELGAAALRVTRAVMAAGLKTGEHAAIWASNRAEWAVAALGVMGAGGSVVPLNTRLKGEEAAYILERSSSRLLFTEEEFLGNRYLDMIVGRVADDMAVIPFDTETYSEFLDNGNGITANDAIRRAGSVVPRDISDVMFTSGTTGHPKGVMIAHDQNLRSYTATAENAGIRAGDRSLVIAPFATAFGFKSGWLTSVLTGATSVVVPVFDVVNTMRLIESERITVFTGTPTMLESVLQHPDRKSYDLTSLRLCITGGAELRVDFVHRLQTELFETVITAYGMTEATGTMTVSRRTDSPEKIATTCGRPSPGVEVRIVDDNMVDVEPGADGEIVVRGYNVMIGYLDDPVATSNAIDSDGWLHTGDIGAFDADGYMRIRGRKKDMYIAGGFNVYPAEVEIAMLKSPAVAACAVIGVPDKRLGEVGAAFVVLREGLSATADELIGWLRTRIATYKVPRSITFCQALPMNSNGKVIKSELASLLPQREETGVAS